jgi:hypothetical protein
MENITVGGQPVQTFLDAELAAQIEETRQESIKGTTFRSHIVTKNNVGSGAEHGEVKSLANGEITLTLAQMQDEVIHLVSNIQKRTRKNREERLKAGQLLLRIREEMTLADPRLTRFGHPEAFWKWVRQKSGLSYSQAHNWIAYARTGQEHWQKSPARERITYWQQFDKKMKACTTEAERIGHFLQAITYLQKSYQLPYKISLAKTATVGAAVKGTR